MGLKHRPLLLATCGWALQRDDRKPPPDRINRDGDGLQRLGCATPLQ